MKKIILLLILLITNISLANITLPAIFANHMVLQQNDQTTFWGWANPNEVVTINPSWTKETYKVVANNQAYWKINVKTPKAGGPFTIKFKGYNEIILNDVLIGEVWVCSGQSNMEMNASWGIKNGEEEIQKANHPTIRFFNIEKVPAEFPQNNLFANWEVCSPETMKHSSAVAYFFAEKLQSELNNVPIGLIISAWGGTPAEAWTPATIINNNPILSEEANKLAPVTYGPTEPGRIFNGMISPIINFKIAGVIWYQGEANVGAQNYDKTFAALIESWRNLWNKNFPFYFAQIAPYNYGNDHYGGVQIRDDQRIVSNEVSNTEMVVTSDISTIDDIHPKDKKSVGTRLANLALVNYYKTNNKIVNGPKYQSYSIKKNKIILKFKYANGLYFKPKQESLFEIAGSDGVFYPAKARIVNQEIELSSKKVKNPKNARFAWGNNIQSNLFNNVNLPASSFKIN